jgi:hypothetical protein
MPYVFYQRRVCEYVCILVSVVANGSVNTCNSRRIVGCISFMSSVFYQRRVCEYVCVSLYRCYATAQ